MMMSLLTPRMLWRKWLETVERPRKRRQCILSSLGFSWFYWWVDFWGRLLAVDYALRGRRLQEGSRSAALQWTFTSEGLEQVSSVSLLLHWLISRFCFAEVSLVLGWCLFISEERVGRLVSERLNSWERRRHDKLETDSSLRLGVKILNESSRETCVWKNSSREELFSSLTRVLKELFWSRVSCAVFLGWEP